MTFKAYSILLTPVPVKPYCSIPRSRKNGINRGCGHTYSDARKAYRFLIDLQIFRQGESIPADIPKIIAGACNLLVIYSLL